MQKPAKATRKLTSRRKRRSPPKAADSEAALKPVRLTKAKLAAQKKQKKTDGSGPLEWLLPMLESSYTPLTDQRAATSEAVVTTVTSALDSRTAATLAAAQPTIWRDVFL